MDPSLLQTYAVPPTLAVLEGSIKRAHEGSCAVTLAHVIDALLSDGDLGARVPKDVRDAAKGALAARIAATPTSREPGRFGFDFGRLFEHAVQVAKGAGNDKVTPLVLLAACLTDGAVREPDARAVVDQLRAKGLVLSVLFRPKAQQARAYTYAPLGFGEDLTARWRDEAGAPTPLVGLEREVRQLVARLAGGSESIVLVGEPGVGKSALIEGLAYHVARGTRPLVPPSMDDLTVVSISVGALMSDTGNRGALEKRIEETLAFFRAHKKVVPFFDEIHTLIDVNEPTTRGIANALKPPLASGQFRCVGATTDTEYARFIAGDRALKSRFTPITVPEPTFDEAVQILKMSLPHLVPEAAREAGVDVGADAIESAVRVTMRYQRSDRLPRKAIRLLKSAVSEKTYAVQTGAVSDRTLSGLDVARSYSEASGIPVNDLQADQDGYAAEVAGRLKNHVRGQDPAIEAVASWLQLHSYGWCDPRRPRGRFLFLGPPGVGKTELSNAIAAEVLRDAGSVVVKNMGEFKGDGAKSRWMGADPGYVGFGQTETVYSRVMMRPFSVVVLDEIEKAHASLADPLLSVLDGGAEDGQGRWVDFSQAVFVMTSNAIQTQERMTDDQIRAMLKEIGGIFTPPFVDRIDRVVLFRALDDESLRGILDVIVAKRKKAASRPLPEAIDAPATRDTILGWAKAQAGAASARGLERAVARWLEQQVGRGA